MAVAVVQLLEIVHIDVHDHGIFALSTRDAQVLFGERHEAATIIESCQIVGQTRLPHTELITLA